MGVFSHMRRKSDTVLRVMFIKWHFIESMNLKVLAAFHANQYSFAKADGHGNYQEDLGCYKLDYLKINITRFQEKTITICRECNFIIYYIIK